MESNDKMVYEWNELCEVLSIGKNTAYELLNSGKIRAFKIGAVWKINKASVQEYIDRMCDIQDKKIQKEMIEIVK